MNAADMEHGARERGGAWRCAALTVAVLMALSPNGFAQDAGADSPDVEVTEGASETRERRGAVAPTGRIDALQRQDIEATGAASLVEALRYRPGVRLDNECSICNTTRIRLGGLPGDYTLVTIDGIPLYGSLGAAYGLLQVDTAAMARIEILRGVNSVLYGSNAVAGVVDVVTRRPSGGLAEGVFELGSFQHRRATGTVGYGSDSASALVSGFYAHHEPVDRDGDGVSEYTGFQRSGFTMTGRALLGERNTFNARGAFFSERRQGGTAGASLLASFDDPDRRVLNETILTERLELGARNVTDLGPGQRLTVVLAGAYHEQDSDYEGELYRARQTMGHAQGTFEMTPGPRYEVAFGLSYRLELLRESVALEDFNYHQPGMFALGRWRPLPALEVAHGVRLDYHNEFGEAVIPEIGVRWTPTSILELFVTGGAGFRAPTTFFELFKGVRQQGYSLVNAADSPERSWSVSGGADIDAASWLEFNVYGAWTTISDPLTVETFAVDAAGNPTDGVSRVEVRSSSGSLGVGSIELGATLVPIPWLNAELGWSAYVYDDPQGTLQTAPPGQQGTLSLIAAIPGSGTTINITGEVTGPMDLASVYGKERYEVLGDDPTVWFGADPQPGTAFDPNDPKLDESPWFGVLNLRIAQRLTSGLELHLGVDNLLDYHQSDIDGPLYFVIEDGEPIADVVHIWGPMRGRFVYGGLTVRL